jgi:hypothetical protein
MRNHVTEQQAQIQRSERIRVQAVYYTDTRCAGQRQTRIASLCPLLVNRQAQIAAVYTASSRTYFNDHYRSSKIIEATLGIPKLCLSIEQNRLPASRLAGNKDDWAGHSLCISFDCPRKRPQYNYLCWHVSGRRGHNHYERPTFNGANGNSGGGHEARPQLVACAGAVV